MEAKAIYILLPTLCMTIGEAPARLIAKTPI